MQETATNLMFQIVLYSAALVGVAWSTDSDESLKKYLQPAANVPVLHIQEPRSTDNTFLSGPNGEHCILHDKDIQDLTYEHQDGQGMKCCCSVCKPGLYVQQFCQCEEGEEMPSPGKDTVCAHVRNGFEFMDKHNKCTQPYNCSEHRNAHQHKVSDCTTEADLVCKCDDGWFNPDPSDSGSVPKTCRPKPLCLAGEEPRKIKRTGLIKFECKTCHKGHFKAESNNWKRCEPHRRCTIQRGDTTTDNVCLNDDRADWQPQTKEPYRVEEQTTQQLEDALPTPSLEVQHQDQGYTTIKPTSTPKQKASATMLSADDISKASASVDDVKSPPKFNTVGVNTWPPEAYFALGAAAVISLYLFVQLAFYAWLKWSYETEQKY